MTSARLAEAVSHHQSGNPDLACAVCFSILQEAPCQVDALLLVAAIWLGQRHGDAARMLLALALKVQPGHPEAARLLPLAGQAAGHPAQAASPDSIADGMAAWNERNYPKALACWHLALALGPARAELHNFRARALAAMGFEDAALADVDRALALDAGFAEAHNTRGVLLHRLERRVEAAESYRRAIALRPAHALTQTNLGNVLLELGQVDAAMAQFESALAANPESADAHCGIGMIALQRGDFARGWREYEWRWQRSDRKEKFRDYRQPLWRGEAELKGKRVWLWSEQGFGDSIQFCRYALTLADMGAQVFLEAPAPLAPLFRTLDRRVAIVEKGAEPPPFEVHCPLLSLPLALGTTMDSLAGSAYLRADPARVAVWRSRLGPRLAPRVGLAWSGNPKFMSRDARAIPLPLLAQGLPASLDCMVLQTEFHPSDKDWLARHPQVRCFADQVKDFADTAALIENLDLVITVDTSIAHLAGALGKEAWILLSSSPDWRWFANRTDSPWYESARLFRQPTPGDWDSVVRDIRQPLALRFATR